MSAYFVANYTVNDADEYRKYLQLVGPTLSPFNAKILVAGGDHTIKEGTPAPITIVLEFPNREALDGWYNSEEYKKVINIRLDNTDGWAIFADSWQS